MLEDRLRDLFAERAEPIPATIDAAGRAMRRARRIRRRQVAVTSVAAAAVLVVIVAGLGSLGGWQAGEDQRSIAPVAPFDVTAEPTDLSPPSAAPPVVASAHPHRNDVGVDLRSGNQLWTADGKRLALTGVGEVTRIYRVPRGWVYGGEAQVRFMRPDGGSMGSIGAGDGWIVSPDGGRIAVVVADALHVARLDDSGIAVEATAAIPAGTAPVAFAGERVVLAGPSSTGYGLLDPARPAAPAWNRDVLAVFGQHRSGLAGLVRRAGSGTPCLAVLRAAPGLPVLHAGGCGPHLVRTTGVPRLSPDGAWLAVTDATSLSIIDVARATSGHPATKRCPVRPSVAPAWAGSVIVTADERGLIRCRTDGRLDVVSPPAGIGSGWQVVPALTAARAVPATRRASPTTAA
jgi:hypothetical protein